MGNVTTMKFTKNEDGKYEGDYIVNGEVHQNGWQPFDSMEDAKTFAKDRAKSKGDTAINVIFVTDGLESSGDVFNLDEYEQTAVEAVSEEDEIPEEIVPE